jgi:predicted Zn-dependent protease with MMP-like domain
MNFSRLAQMASEVVESTLRTLPADVREAAQGVPVHFEAKPDDDVIAEGFEPDILGLFCGTPHGEDLALDHPLPPQIFLYINSLWDFSEGDAGAYRDEVRLTYLHELGHYLGWDEDEVAARGLD